jgi:hypothetical protein
MDIEYSYCEPTWAGSNRKWCIRRLTKAGKKCGGNVDTNSLCRRVHIGGGWDIQAEMDKRLTELCCPDCRAAYEKEVG